MNSRSSGPVYGELGEEKYHQLWTHSSQNRLPLESSLRRQRHPVATSTEDKKERNRTTKKKSSALCVDFEGRSAKRGDPGGRPLPPPAGKTALHRAAAARLLNDVYDDDDDDDPNSGDECTRNKVAIGDGKAAPGWKQNTGFLQKYKYTNTNAKKYQSNQKYKL